MKETCGVRMPLRVVVVSQSAQDLDVSGLCLAVEDVLAVKTLHVNGDLKRYSQSGFDRSFLILLYDAEPYQTIQTLQLLRRYHAEEPILVVTPKQDEAYLLSIYEAGADECIDAGASLALLLAKLRVWLRWTAISLDSPFSPE